MQLCGVHCWASVRYFLVPANMLYSYLQRRFLNDFSTKIDGKGRHRSPNKRDACQRFQIFPILHSLADCLHCRHSFRCCMQGPINRDAPCIEFSYLHIAFYSALWISWRSRCHTHSPLQNSRAIQIIVGDTGQSPYAQKNYRNSWRFVVIVPSWTRGDRV